MQEFVSIENVELLNTAQHMKNEGFRLAQACVTRLDRFVFAYTFEKGGRYVHLSFETAFDEPVESIGWLFPYAFLYENEMLELFGVKISDLSVDLEGSLYKTAVKTPFGGEEVVQDGN